MKAKPKIMLIANPMAGNKALSAKWNKEIYPFLKENIPAFSFEFTKRKGHATQLAAQAIENGYQLIVSMGGDGTNNEIVNGFFDGQRPRNPDACFGVLPFGSGGDFIRTLGIERDFKKAALRLNSKKFLSIDIGRVEFSLKNHPARYFINAAEVGLGALIMNRVNSKNKTWPALIRYVTGSFQGFLDYKNTLVDLTLDNKKKTNINLTNLIVANGQYFGRGMRPAPKAKLDDGLFDILVIKDLNFLKFVKNFHKLYGKKKRLPTSILETHRCRAIEVQVHHAPGQLKTELDGETCGSGHQKISLLPGVLKFKV